MKNTKILVTGGAGFIGSHLVETFVGQGAQVTILDNLSTGSLENLKTVKDNISFIQGDIKNLDECLKASSQKEIIFHLAAMISVAESMKNPQACYETNVAGTMNMLEAARQNKVKRFLLSSSAAVYGPQEKPCHEEMLCTPESPYGHSKLLGEILCKNYWQNYKLETVCLRYFNVFGQRQNPHGDYAAVVAAFRNCMQENKPITIFGDGTQTRDFIAVEDVVAANLSLAEASTQKVAGQVFNVATGLSISLLELIDTLSKDFPDYKKELIFKPARSGEIKHSVALCRKYQQVINL